MQSAYDNPEYDYAAALSADNSWEICKCLRIHLINIDESLEMDEASVVLVQPQRHQQQMQQQQRQIRW